MSIVAEFSLPPRAIPGGETLESLPEATIELERLVPMGDAALPFFWVVDADPQRFRERFQAEEGSQPSRYSPRSSRARCSARSGRPGGGRPGDV